MSDFADSSNKTTFLVPIIVGLLALLGCNETQSVNIPNPTHHEIAGPARHTLVKEQSQAHAARKKYEDRPSVANSIVIGLDADMTSLAAEAGEAIRRGAVLAIDEINASGGLLNRPVELVVRDDRGNPDRGKQNIREFSKMRDVLAVIGGKHTPVVLQELPLIQEARIPFLIPWAAGTPIIANGYDPNFAFRVSVRDEYAGAFLVDCALARGKQRIALLMERTTWGRSNEKAISEACLQRGLEPVAIEWLNWGERDLSRQVERIAAADADVILLVCNSPEGAIAMKEIACLHKETRPIVVSHWGIATNRFYELAADDLPDVDFTFLQTFSFDNSESNPRAKQVLANYRNHFHHCPAAARLKAPVGTAQAYELVMMLAQAVRNTNQLEPTAVVRALEALQDYSGLIRHYQRPFASDHHDALTVDDFFLAEFDHEGAIRRVQQ